MLAGIWAARNVAGADLDVWSINVEQEYHEESDSEGGAVEDRLVPLPLADLDLEDLLRQAFGRYDPIALGVATGTVAGLGLFVATGLLLLKGGSPPGPTLSLLGNYFLCFEVSWPGAFLGVVEAGFQEPGNELEAFYFLGSRFTGYAREELVAEMGAAFLCGHAGIESRVVESSASYIHTWLGRLRNDTKLVVHAAAQAQKAADYVLGRSYVEGTSPE